MMAKAFDIEIKLSAREWQRQFYTAVVRSLAKTITEPVTNSDTSYKRLFGLPDASGLVEKALAFPKGSRFDLTQAKETLLGKSRAREIQIHLYTAKGHGRTCEVADFAEGMIPEELRLAFEEFAADKTDVSKGRPGRSLFGRGVSDVLLGHRGGVFASYKDGTLTRLTFTFDREQQKSPKATAHIVKRPKASDVDEWRLDPKRSGSCVRVVLHEDCRIPQEGSLIPRLAQFYMLRLINADPNVTVRVFRHRASGKVTEDVLDYDFPLGDVIERFSFSIANPVPGADLAPIAIDGIVCRATVKGDLPGAEAGELRANGLLLVDDKDAVLDLTLLPQFERAPYLNKIFGLVRLTNVRAALEWYLNNGKASPLTTSRDGFDEKHEFTKVLFRQLLKHLEPVYRREEDRFHRSSQEVSKEVKERIDEAIRELNRLLKELAGEARDGDEPVKLDPAAVLQFVPSKTRLVVGRRRIVRVYFKTEFAHDSGTIVYDTSNSKIKVKPASHEIASGRAHKEYRVYEVSLECDSLQESGKLTALAEGRKDMYEAEMEVTDVIPERAVVAPEEMEFRPDESHGHPNRNNAIGLFVNSSVIPLGRKIVLELEKARGSIGLMEDRKRVEKSSVRFEKSHLIESTNVGRIPVAWQGTGWGQQATVVARTKKVDGVTGQARGRIVLEEPDDGGGLIRGVEYMDLRNDKCSDLVDGIIYINSNHYLNRVVFGPTKKEYNERMESHGTAQYRFAGLVLEQSVYRLAEESVRESRLVLQDDAPVTSLREFIDTQTQKYAPRIMKAVARELT